MRYLHRSTVPRTHLAAFVHAYILTERCSLHGLAVLEFVFKLKKVHNIRPVL